MDKELELNFELALDDRQNFSLSHLWCDKEIAPTISMALTQQHYLETILLK
ncbi:hypothetical protein JHK82_012417 [Glycine max]|nr:hypothetical protein JHK82_012417 [Glycine max]